VYPELNFTLPPLTIEEATWAQVRGHYERIAEMIVRRSTALHVPGLVVEFEQLPAMTDRPQWGAEITAILAAGLKKLHEATGIPCALRVTVVDLRDAVRPPLLRTGDSWGRTKEAFICAAQAGADILSIESIGGKEVHDEALVYGDLDGIVFALGVLSCRDMAFLWDEITAIARQHNSVSGGDTACGFGNTAMQLAGKGMLPTALAALVRAATCPRSLVAYEHGAVGPSKDCAYEGPVMKAIAGVPISMEGKSSSCAHFSPLGNIAGAAADLWSNESVQNIQLLSGPAPEAFLELLAYDCRLFNVATRSGEAKRLRDWLVASDTPTSAEALMLEPTTVIDLSKAIVAAGENGYARTLAAVRVARDAISAAINAGRLALPAREKDWLKRLNTAVDNLPETEAEAIERASGQYAHLYRPEAYGLEAGGG
ncbi:MAG TPA: methyltransferase MtaB domain-containing protein, partial [Phycisphaerae bacterium]|nr:methyltransferase MtaB domain-containing protein [Phycisphaerae bacterium]